MDAKEPKLTLQQKVSQWLSQEGYPLEFFTATTFRKHGFGVWQGYYAEDTKTSAVREIDIIAYVDRRLKDGFLRIEHVVECKWTKEKPWVVFCAKSASMAPAACISQTIASKLARAILWLIAGEKTLHSTSTFSTPSTPGFGGRQVFTKDNDAFYTAIQSVIAKAKSEADDFGLPALPPKKLPRDGCVFLPVIVIEGELFEATYDEVTQTVVVNQVPKLRLHWRGSEAWRWHASVDIVVKDHLNEFVAQRQSEMKGILDAMEAGYDNIAECFRKQSLGPLNVTKGPRGMLGLPSLLVPLVPKKKSGGRTKK
jgi:hypothetical protein